MRMHPPVMKWYKIFVARFSNCCHDQDNLCPPLVSTGAKTKYLVVYFILTHKLVFSMVLAKESNVLSPESDVRELVLGKSFWWDVTVILI